MSRTSSRVLSKAKLIAAGVVIAAGLTVSGVIYNHDHPYQVAQTAGNVQVQTDQISYDGQNGVDALTLLKKYATVQTKHYSFGDFVQSINGKVGNGPKYWTFYVNGQQSQVGASSYVTKSSDKINWKLQ